jgi:hypothetical protein
MKEVFFLPKAHKMPGTTLLKEKYFLKKITFFNT